jgi:hypothetical protein
MAGKASRKPVVVEGQVADYIARDEFRRRFEANFFDPAFARERDAIKRLEAIAWDGYKNSRKAPITRRRAGDSPIPITTSPSNGDRRAIGC